MPNAYDVHEDAILTNFASAFEQTGFICDQALPVVKVAKESDKYYKYYPKDVLYKPIHSQRADGAEAVETSWDLTTGTYQCEEYALRDIVTDRARKNQDQPLNLDMDTTKILIQQLMVEKEYRVAEALFNTTTFTSYHSALSTAYRWDNYTSSDSDPLAYIDTAKESVGKYALRRANTVIMGEEVFDHVKHHPIILDRIKYGSDSAKPALVTPNLLAQAFGVDQVLVGTAWYNSATEGQTVTPARIWGKYVMVAYIESSPSIKSPTLGFQPHSQNMTVSKWREDKRKGDIIEVSYVSDEVIVNAGSAYLYSTVVS